MSKVKQVIRAAAHTVRDAGRMVRSAVTAEYLHKTVESVVDHVEKAHPQGKAGKWKFAIARVLLRRILGVDEFNASADDIGELITEIVAMKRSSSE